MKFLSKIQFCSRCLDAMPSPKCLSAYMESFLKQTLRYHIRFIGSIHNNFWRFLVKLLECKEWMNLMPRRLYSNWNFYLMYTKGLQFKAFLLIRQNDLALITVCFYTTATPSPFRRSFYLILQWFYHDYNFVI